MYINIKGVPGFIFIIYKEHGPHWVSRMGAHEFLFIQF